MSITITKVQKKAMVSAGLAINKLIEIKSVTNDLLRPMAKKTAKKYLPESFNGKIPDNNDPLAWSDFTQQKFGFGAESPVWFWLFAHDWITAQDKDIDPLQLRMNAELLEVEIGKGFIAAAEKIITREVASAKDDLITRYNVISEHLNIG